MTEKSEDLEVTVQLERPEQLLELTPEALLNEIGLLIAEYEEKSDTVVDCTILFATDPERQWLWSDEEWEEERI